MESNKTSDADASQWQKALVFASRSREAGKTHWQPVVFAAVCFLHAALIAYGYRWQNDLLDNKLSEEVALQISFIDRIVESELKPADSAGKKNKTQVSIPPRETIVLDAAASVISDSAVIDQDSRALRLTMDTDEWKPSAALAPRDPLKRQYIALPGRSDPFIHGIKLANKITPEQRLQQVGKLFGAVDYDACKEARNRMASGQSQQAAFDLEHDLRTIERHCRP